MQCIPTVGCIVFQSALPQGERPQSCCTQIRQGGFQSALPRGERPTRSPFLFPHPLFQPALPRGSDLPPCGCASDNSLISTHAPAWGATSTTIPAAPST